MKYLYQITALAVVFCVVCQAKAQCPNDNDQYGTTSAASWVEGTTNTISTCLYGGEYRLVTGLTSGYTYSFETCGDTDFDTQITIYDAATDAYLTYNDDFCGLQSKVTFTASSDQIKVLIDRYYCSGESSCMTLKGTLVNAPAPFNPCDNSVELQCDVDQAFNLQGSGAWYPDGPWDTPGQEAVFSVTPELSGLHTLSISNSGYYVDLFVMTDSCDEAGWIYVDDIYTSATHSFDLTVGVTYYFLVDDENTAASSGTISLFCPEPPPPASAICILPSLYEPD